METNEMEIKLKKRKAFTLVELLAVIVILAVILVVSVPQIINTINTSRLASFKSSAEMVISEAEKQYMIDQTEKADSGEALSVVKYGGIGTASSGADRPCTFLTELSENDYATCEVTVSTEGVATITEFTGKGKFKGYTCTGTKEAIACTGAGNTENNSSSNNNNNNNNQQQGSQETYVTNPSCGTQGIAHPYPSGNVIYYEYDYFGDIDNVIDEYTGSEYVISSNCTNSEYFNYHKLFKIAVASPTGDEREVRDWTLQEKTAFCNGQTVHDANGYGYNINQGFGLYDSSYDGVNTFDSYYDYDSTDYSLYTSGDGKGSGRTLLELGLYEEKEPTEEEKREALTNYGYKYDPSTTDYNEFYAYSLDTETTYYCTKYDGGICFNTNDGYSVVSKQMKNLFLKPVATPSCGNHSHDTVITCQENYTGYESEEDCIQNSSYRFGCNETENSIYCEDGGIHCAVDKGTGDNVSSISCGAQ